MDVNALRRTARILAAPAVLLVLAAPLPARPGEKDLPPVQQVVVEDFDGDGFPDVAVGLPDLKAGKVKEAGEVRVYSGKTGVLLWNLAGTEEGQACGEALALAGDVDEDGAPDLAVGNPWAEAGPHILFLSGKTGRVHHRFGSNFPLSFSEHLCGFHLVDWTVGGRPSPQWIVLARAGLSGRWWGVDNRKESYSAFFEDSHGMQCDARAAGDLNGDGYRDAVLCAWSAEVGGKKGAGLLRLLSGETLSGVTQPKSDRWLGEIAGTRENENLGLLVEPAGDWNGDRRADLLLGTRGDGKKKGETWTLRVLSPLDRVEIALLRGPEGETVIGGAAVPGDADGDGTPDVLAGTPQRGRGIGAAALLSGKDGKVLWTVDGTGSERFGEGVYRAGDADGDGVAEAWVLAPGTATNGKKGKGYLRLLSGKTGAVLSTVNPLALK